MKKPRVKKRFISLDIDNSHKPEYSIRSNFPKGTIGLNDKPGSIKLFHHPAGGWVNELHGKLSASLKNDGNGVSISFRKGPKFRLNYSELYQLRILTNLDKERSKEIGFKEDTIIVNCCKTCGGPKK